MLTFICGQLCCGKTSFAKSFAEINDGYYIELGDIVRNIKQSEDRKTLQDSKELANEIAAELRLIEKQMFPKVIVASGPRQVEIIEQFPEATLLWIECPTKTRNARYSFRARNGDNSSFEEAEQGDIKLGILKVKEYILTKQY